MSDFKILIVLFKIINKNLKFKSYILYIFFSLASLSEGLVIMISVFYINFSIGGNFSNLNFIYYFRIMDSFDIFNIKHSGFLCFIFFLIIIRSIFIYYGFKLISICQTKIITNYKKKFIKTFQGLDYQFYLQKNSGYYSELNNNQINLSFLCINNYFVTTTFIINILFYFVLFFYVSIKLSLVLFISCFAYIFITKKVSKLTFQYSKKYNDENIKYTNKIIEISQNFKYLVSSNRYNIFQNLLLEKISYIYNLLIKIGNLSAFNPSIKEPLLFIVIVIMYAINYFYLSSPLANIIIILIFSQRLLGSISLLNSSFKKLLENYPSIIFLENELENIKNNQVFSGKSYIGDINQIVFKNLSFYYQNSQNYIFENLNLKLLKGKKYLITGKSGSGKTTLLNILTLLLPISKGQFFVNKIDSHNLEKISYRNNIGYVSQESSIFEESIYFNITLKKEIDKKDLPEIINLCKKMDIYDFIKDLDDGFNYLVGDRGSFLSGGQRQRILIVRELFKKPSILILDEATSALNENSEKKIISSLKDLDDILLIMVCHKISDDSIFDQKYILLNNDLKRI